MPNGTGTAGDAVAAHGTAQPGPEASGYQTPARQHDMGFKSNRNYFTICIYSLFVIAVGTIIIYMIMNLSQTRAALGNLLSTLSPFLGALFIAFLLNPIVVFFDRKFFGNLCRMKPGKLRKGLSIFFSYALAIGMITVGLFYVIPQVGQSLTDLSDSSIVPDIVAAVTHFLENIEEIFPDLDIAWIEEKLTEITPNLFSFGTDFVKNLVPVLYNFSVSIAKLVVNLLLSIVVSCYMLTDKSLLFKNCKRLAYAILPQDRVQRYIHTTKECMNIFTRFITGKTLDSLLIGILCFIVMSLLRMPYALLLSVIVGLTNMIPYFGPFIGAVPGVLIYLFLSPLKALGFVAMILVLQQFDGLYLGPKILGGSTGLKPIWVIFAITVGGAYAGVLGMFLGVPVVAVIAYLINNFIKTRLAKKNIEDDF